MANGIDHGLPSAREAWRCRHHRPHAMAARHREHVRCVCHIGAVPNPGVQVAFCLEPIQCPQDGVARHAQGFGVVTGRRELAACREGAIGDGLPQLAVDLQAQGGARCFIGSMRWLQIGPLNRFESP